MASNSVPVPASVAENLASAALEEVPRIEADGREATAQRVEQHARVVLQQTSSVHGSRFVSLSGRALSAIAAKGTVKATLSDLKAARYFLKRYNVWG